MQPIPARCTVALVMATLACVVPCRAQTVGEAEISVQSYYAAGSQQTLAETTGASFTFRDFIPRFGLLQGSFQGWSDRGEFRGGDNFLELSGVALLGRHWTVSGGDFRLSTQLVRNPFINVYNPDISARGFRLQIEESSRTYSFFGGAETLLQGPRIPFRMRVPQQVAGASMVQKIGTNWQVGARFLHLWADDTPPQPLFVATARKFDAVDIFTVQALYTFSKHLKLYGEAAESVTSGGDPGPKGPPSVYFGPAWESERLRVRANYVRQDAAYLPLPGYLAGDRRGPFVEAQYRLHRKVSVHASASRYTNNLDNDPRVPTLRSATWGAGASAALPWKLAANADVTVIRLRQRGGASGAVEPANNRQILLSVSRPVWRQTLRFTAFDLNFVTGNGAQRQQSAELEDTFMWRRLAFGGAVRLQRTLDQNPRNTVYVRGSAQLNLRQASAYAQLQRGTDLVSQSLFATSSFSSTVFGFNVPLLKGARLQMEAFRNQITSTLTPASLFVLESRGAEIPATLAGFNQWSVYARVARQLRWGRGGGEMSSVTPQVPLVGAVEGKVSVVTAGHAHEAAGVPVILDNGRIARTDPQGRYKFIDVPEGLHEVRLAVRELPVEFEPGEPKLAQVKVLPRAIARADFSVKRLTSLEGKVLVPAGVAPDSIIIRLLPTERYTTPEADGSFGFYNLPEGEYQVSIDAQTLPEESVLQSPAAQAVAARADAPGAPVQFLIAAHPRQKPVRMLFQQEIRTGERH